MFFDLSSPIVTIADAGRVSWPWRFRMKQLRELGAVVLLTAAIFTPAIIAAQTPAPPPGGGIPDLVGPLRATPGVLGVDAAQTISGKQVIFAWFENKHAVLNWYNSDVHRQLMNGFSGGGGATGGAPRPA